MALLPLLTTILVVMINIIAKNSQKISWQECNIGFQLLMNALIILSVQVVSNDVYTTSCAIGILLIFIFTITLAFLIRLVGQEWFVIKKWHTIRAKQKSDNAVLDSNGSIVIEQFQLTDEAVIAPIIYGCIMLAYTSVILSLT